MSAWIGVLGLVAAATTTLSIWMQTIKTIRTRSTKDVSLAMYIFLAVGIALWLVYGSLIGDLPLIIANVFTLTATLTTLVYKLKYG